MIDEEMEKSIWSWKEHILARCKIDLSVLSGSSVDLFNSTKMVGAFYGLIESVNPVASKMFHGSTNVKPWSFSSLLFRRMKRMEDGYHHIEEDNNCQWYVNTTSNFIRDAIIDAGLQKKNVHFGKVIMKICKINVEDCTYASYPEDRDIDTITLKIHSPAIWYDSREKKFLKLETRTFVDTQIRKMQSLGIISNECSIENIEPFIRILRDDTVRKSLSISGIPGVIHGRGGHITFKISGRTETRQLIWEILHTSVFTGIGVRTSMGFGHCSISSISLC